MKIVERNKTVVKIQSNNYACYILSNLKEDLRKIQLSGNGILTLR